MEEETQTEIPPLKVTSDISVWAVMAFALHVDSKDPAAGKIAGALGSSALPLLQRADITCCFVQLMQLCHALT